MLLVLYTDVRRLKPVGKITLIELLATLRMYLAIDESLEGWDIASKVKSLIMVNLVAAKTILVPSVIQVHTQPPRGLSG